MRGNHHPAHPRLPRERAGVKRSRAAIGDEGEAAKVVAALHGDQPQRAQHARIGDLHHAVRGGGEREAEALRNEAQAPPRPGRGLIRIEPP